jgi:hypothetical protein
MLDESSSPVAVGESDGGRTYSAPPFVRCEDIGTVGTTEQVLRFAVLRKYQPGVWTTTGTTIKGGPGPLRSPRGSIWNRLGI